MNKNNDYKSGTIPYKATANLNTTIGNPNVSINDAMNINIKTMSTLINNQTNEVQSNSCVVPNAPLTSSTIKSKQTPTQTQIVGVSNSVTDQNIAKHHENNNASKQNIQDSTTIKKTYVNINNNPKKKTITFNVGPEFKIAIFIIVILLVFVFLLPIISNFIFGY